MMLFNSDIAGRYGANPRKLSQNRLVITWDGNDSADAYLDARTLYRDGNNQGVNFFLTGTGCTCEVSGSAIPMPSPYSEAELAARSWFLIGAMDAGANTLTLADLRLFSVIYLNFTGAPGSMSIVR
jgi:hypothetical protein